MKPGEIKVAEADNIIANVKLDIKIIEVSNVGDRPIQVGSHYHFYEVNKYLKFDRSKALGFRLNIPAGTAVRFEPGMIRKIEVIALSGKREVYGFNGKVNGLLPK